MNTKGYYSLIQYCPDFSRLEVANIGVLLFCPEQSFLNARTSRDHDRVRRFFGREGHDWSQLLSFRRGLQERIQRERSHISGIEDLERFISLRANQIQITPPRPMAVADPEQDLNRLFLELVGGDHVPRPRVDFKRHLGDRFANAGLQKKLATDIHVHVPVVNREIEVPYGFQNGRFNLIQPIPFESQEPRHDENKACQWAVQGRSLYETPNPQYGDVQMIVVARFGAGNRDRPANVRRILDEWNVKMYPEGDLHFLIDEIRRTGRDLQPD